VGSLKGLQSRAQTKIFLTKIEKKNSQSSMKDIKICLEKNESLFFKYMNTHEWQLFYFCSLNGIGSELAYTETEISKELLRIKLRFT
jgi:hypothetical protein